MLDKLEVCPLHIHFVEERFLGLAVLGYWAWPSVTTCRLMCDGVAVAVQRIEATNLSCRAPFAYIAVATRAVTCRALMVIF